MHKSQSDMTTIKRRRPVPRTLIAGGAMLLPAGLLQLCARKCPGFGQWYAVEIYPLITGTLGRFIGYFPFSVVEFGLYGLILLCLIFLARNLKRPAKLLCSAFCLASALALVFTLNCGINYYRLPFSAHSGLEIQKSSTEELYSLCSYLVDQINSTEEKMSAVSPYEGQTRETPPPTFGMLYDYGTEARAAMEGLGDEFPELGGFYPPQGPPGIAHSLRPAVVRHLLALHGGGQLQPGDAPLQHPPHPLP